MFMNRLSFKQRIGFAVFAALACTSTLTIAVLAPLVSAGALA
jgi:hypothetical protein